jgi:transcriptional regulator with XRE-family HTH domain
MLRHDKCTVRVPQRMTNAGRAAVRIEEFIGRGITQCRTNRNITQAELGDRLARFTGKAWSRQAVSSAEAGKRSFTAADLLALSFALDVPVTLLLCPLTDDPDTDNFALDLPSGERLPGSKLLEACFGPEEQRGGGEFLPKLVDTWAEAQVHATRLQFLIRRFVGDEAASDIFGDYLQTEEGELTSGEGTDS